jgi:phytoene synthase
MLSVDESYDYCRTLTRRTAHNFRFSFLTLPRDKRRAMNALYAFNRITDDFGDDPTVSLDLRKTQLAAWRRSVHAALAALSPDGQGDLPRTAEVATLDIHPALPAIADMVGRYQIPLEYLFAVIDGVEMDLNPNEGGALGPISSHMRADGAQPIAQESNAIETFADLQRYCYHVAGAVGLCCIHVWGFTDERAKSLAVDCGLALQLTNILRDLGEDASLGRIYLPSEDLRRFEYSPDDLQRHVVDDRFRALMAFEVTRTRSYYQRAEQLFGMLHPSGRPILRAMLDIYGGLLTQIERNQYDVYSRRVSLTKWKKLWIAGRAILQQKLSRAR